MQRIYATSDEFVAAVIAAAILLSIMFGSMFVINRAIGVHEHVAHQECLTRPWLDMSHGC